MRQRVNSKPSSPTWVGNLAPEVALAVVVVRAEVVMPLAGMGLILTRPFGCSTRSTTTSATCGSKADAAPADPHDKHNPLGDNDILDSWRTSWR
jgi:hypothetical protein